MQKTKLKVTEGHETNWAREGQKESTISLEWQQEEC